MNDFPSPSREESAADGVQSTGQPPTVISDESLDTGSSESVAKHLIEHHDAFVFDMDGVLWRGGHLIEGSLEAIRFLNEEAHKLVFFATNNSAATPQELKERFERLGFGSFPLDRFYCTSWVAAGVLREHGVTGKVLVLGTEQLAEMVSEVPGVEVVTLANRPAMPMDLDRLELDASIRAVVIGIDPFFSYFRLAYATALLNELPPEKCLFIATNEDINFPTKKHKVAGTGTLVKSLVAAVHRQPIMCGKPSLLIADRILQRHGLCPERICMVGDNLLTDIQFGNDANFTTLLVETGVHTRADIQRFASSSSQAAASSLTPTGAFHAKDAGAAGAVHGSVATSKDSSQIRPLPHPGDKSTRVDTTSVIAREGASAIIDASVVEGAPAPTLRPDFILPSLGIIITGRSAP